MFAEIFTVICGDDNQRVFIRPGILQILHELANPKIEISDRGRVP